ncbi:MAG TPA: hypothetical protein VFZ53_21815 [Polyangiaceae bacterium]
MSLGACGAGRANEPSAPGPSAPAAPSTPTPDANDAPPTDDEAKAVIAKALAHVAEIRRLAAKTPVKGAVISRDALLARIKNDLLVDLEPDLIEGTRELLFALNLTRGDFDYFENLLLLYGTQLAGFYDPQAKEMVLLDDLGVEAQEATLWHELVHALQDQNYDLQKLTKWKPERGDAVSAAQSFAEGDATSAMMDMMLLPRGQRALDVPEALVTQSMAAIEALPEVRDVPSILKRSIVAPYTDGLAFTHALRREGEWARVDEAWKQPPETTEQLLHPEKYRAREAAESVPLPPPLPGGPTTVRYRDVLGEQTIRLVLEDWLPLDTARKAASGWAGDRVAVFMDENRRAVGIGLRYDDEVSARRGFEAIVRGALSEPIEKRTGVRSDTADAGAKAARASQFCAERELRGPFAVARSGRDLGVTLGPYTRDSGATRTAASCRSVLPWAARIAKGR